MCSRANDVLWYIEWVWMLNDLPNPVFAEGDDDAAMALWLSYQVEEENLVFFECMSCGEGLPKHDCPKSRLVCGHHCDCSWTQDVCHWCGKEFGEV